MHGRPHVSELAQSHICPRRRTRKGVAAARVLYTHVVGSAATFRSFQKTRYPPFHSTTSCSSQASGLCVVESTRTGRFNIFEAQAILSRLPSVPSRSHSITPCEKETGIPFGMGSKMEPGRRIMFCPRRAHRFSCRDLMMRMQPCSFFSIYKTCPGIISVTTLVDTNTAVLAILVATVDSKPDQGSTSDFLNYINILAVLLDE